MGDDINYGALFGVDVTEENTGAEEQEVTDPAEDDEVSSMSSQSDTRAEADTDNGDETADEEGGKPAQSAEENAKYAAARRKAEADRDAAVAQAKADAQKAIDEACRDLGIIDPFTGRLISTKTEYDAYRQRMDIEKQSRIAKASGMSETEFKEFVSSLPEVKAAREKQAQAEEVLKQAQAERAQIKIGEQIAEISKLDPAVKSIDDLKNMENYSEFYDRVKSGHSLVDAYKLTNFAKLTKASADSAKQAVINSMSGKSHLEKTSGRGTGAVTVPAAVAEAYRVFNPDATEAEIQKHYNKYINR